MSENSDGGTKVDLKDWTPIDQEERTRHDALFFSQSPIEGLLPGEQACELFLRSGLPLPVLSQIWNLVDFPHDNMLDPSEFAAAMHLIQCTLLGRKVPPEMPESLRPDHKEEVRLSMMSPREYSAYRRVFEALGTSRTRLMDAATVRDLLLTSGLSQDQLALVWNLSDVNRDGKLNMEEFAFACHLTRYYKRGFQIDGPVNVTSLLPNRLPKRDLQAKKRRLSELESRKPKLMAIKERRRSEAAWETQRAQLYRKRLLSLRQQKAISEDSGLEFAAEFLPDGMLEKEEAKVNAMETVAQRLKKEHEQVRQETARVIMEEQKLTQQVQELEAEAEKLRQKRQRNSLIKDLDPFHQLHEDRKEERLTGVQKNREKYEVHIPQKTDPFDKEKLKDKPLSGQDLFCSNSFKQSSSPNSGAWATNNTRDLSDLTHGFEDNFVEAWNQPSKDFVSNSKSLISDYDKDFIFEDKDPIFRTISVTEEEDDLWCLLPKAELANQNEQIQLMQEKMAEIKQQITDLNSETGGQLVLKDSAEDGSPAGSPVKRRRQLEEKTEHADGGNQSKSETPGAGDQRIPEISITGPVTYESGNITEASNQNKEDITKDTLQKSIQVKSTEEKLELSQKDSSKSDSPKVISKVKYQSDTSDSSVTEEQDSFETKHKVIYPKKVDYVENTQLESDQVKNSTKSHAAEDSVSEEITKSIPEKPAALTAKSEKSSSLKKADSDRLTSEDTAKLAINHKQTTENRNDNTSIRKTSVPETAKGVVSHDKVGQTREAHKPPEGPDKPVRKTSAAGEGPVLRAILRRRKKGTGSPPARPHSWDPAPQAQDINTSTDSDQGRSQTGSPDKPQRPVSLIEPSPVPPPRKNSPKKKKVPTATLR